MFRYIAGWYADKLPGLNAWLDSEVSRMGMPSLVLLPRFDVTLQMLESDGTHLNPAAGDLFLSHLRQSIQSALTSSTDVDVTVVDEVTNVGSDSDDEDPSVESEDRLEAILKIVKSNSKKLSSVRPLRDTLVRLDERTSAFESSVRLRCQRDNYVFARIKEESDSEVNKSRENRVVISGLARASTGLTSHQQKKDHYISVVTDLIAQACPDAKVKPLVTDVIVSLHRNQVAPSVEAKFETAASALLFRKAASTLAKAQDPGFVNLYFSNSVTQATRVRIEILKAIAKKLTTETKSAFVQSFISRPVMRYVSEDENLEVSGTGRSYSFVDAVLRFGDLVQDADLTSAYKRAGGTFRGAMEQYFILLREAEDVSVASEVNTTPLGVRGGRGGRGGRGSTPLRAATRGFRGLKRPSRSPRGAATKRRMRR